MMTRQHGVGLMVILAAVLIAGASPAHSQDFQPRHGWRGPGSEFLFNVRSLGLTDAQQGQVRQIVTNHRPRFRALVGQLRTAHEQLADELVAPAPVAAADLGPLIQQIAQLRAQLMQEGAQVALEIRAVLTPAQLTKAAQTHQRLKELRTEMRNLLNEGQ